MNKSVLVFIGTALLMTGCGGSSRDLVSLAKRMDAAVNAHDADAFVGFMADDVVIKGPDGSMHRGKDSARVWINGIIPGFHVESIGWQQSGDTVTWMSTVRSDAFGRMGVNPIKSNTMAVFHGDKLAYFVATLDNETQGKMEFLQFFAEVVEGKNVDAIDKFISPDLVEHQPLPPGTPQGREGVKAFFHVMLAAFPDLHVTPLVIMADGDKVLFSSTWEGTNKGNFMGKPASNKKYSWTVADLIRLADGKAVEHWGWDDMAERMGNH
jgi:predicted ester cyclase